MKSTVVFAVMAALCAAYGVTVRTATEGFVTNRIAQAATAATNYTDAAIAGAVKLSENKPGENERIVLWDPEAAWNNPLVAAPTNIRVGDLVPGDYAAVSNAAMSAAAATNDFLRLTGGSIGYLRFPDFDDYGVAIVAGVPTELVFSSNYPGYEDKYAALDLGRLSSDDIDRGQNSIAFLSDIPESVSPETVTNIVDDALAHFDPPIPTFDVYAEDVTNVVYGTVTNGVRTGFTGWECSGDITPGVKYDISSEGDAPPFTFRLWNRGTETEVSSVTDASANPTELTFAVTGGSILANRLPIYKYTTGLASEGAVKRLDQRIDGVDAKVDAVSNDVVTVSNRLETIDTSYWHYSITTGDENVTIANRNQSVTTLISTSAVPSTLHIQIPPEEVMTKDWLIYVFPSTNIVLRLEAATYYVSDASATNDITSATALYFSQVDDGVYTLGRKEFTAITIQNPVEATVSAALQRNSRRAYIK